MAVSPGVSPDRVYIEAFRHILQLGDAREVALDDEEIACLAYILTKEGGRRMQMSVSHKNARPQSHFLHQILDSSHKVADELSVLSSINRLPVRFSSSERNIDEISQAVCAAVTSNNRVISTKQALKWFNSLQDVPEGLLMYLGNSFYVTSLNLYVPSLKESAEARALPTHFFICRLAFFQDEISLNDEPYLRFKALCRFQEWREVETFFDLYAATMSRLRHALNCAEIGRVNDDIANGSSSIPPTVDVGESLHDAEDDAAKDAENGTMLRPALNCAEIGIDNDNTTHGSSSIPPTFDVEQGLHDAEDDAAKDAVKGEGLYDEVNNAPQGGNGVVDDEVSPPISAPADVGQGCVHDVATEENSAGNDGGSPADAQELHDAAKDECFCK